MPKIVCHMMISIDGKIAGRFANTNAVKAASSEYQRICLDYYSKACLCGRVTTDENFTFYRKPRFDDDDAAEVSKGDFVVKKDATIFYISVDTSGRIAWESNELPDIPDSHIIEVLSENVPNAYRAYLRQRSISYIVAGKERLDCRLAAEKLKTLFGIETLLIAGGGFINQSYLNAGLVDELSLVVASVIEGDNNAPTLFRNAGDTSAFIPTECSLIETKTLGNGVAWLRYSIDK